MNLNSNEQNDILLRREDNYADQSYKSAPCALKVLFMASSESQLSFNFVRLAIALEEIGHSVLVVSEPREAERGLFKELKKRGILVHVINGLYDISVESAVKTARALGQIINNGGVDIIHAQGIRHLLVAFLASKFFSRRKRTPIVTSIHTTLHGTSYETATLLVESFLLNTCADLAMPVAKSVTEKLVQFGLLRKKTVTVHNGVDLGFLDKMMQDNEYISLLPVDFLRPSVIIIGYFANLVPRKGHRYLLKAVSVLIKEFPEIRVVLTGNGPLQRQIRELSKDLGIEDIVYLTGKIEYKLLYQLLKRINIYAFPSLAELFPFAILEAMAAKKPIVATTVGGIPEVIENGKTGILIPPKDYVKLAEAIGWLIRNPKKAEEMGEKCRDLVEKNLEISKIAHELTKCYITAGALQGARF